MTALRNAERSLVPIQLPVVLNTDVADRPQIQIQLTAFLITTLLVCLSIVLFLMDSSCDEVGKHLSSQNTASLKLWKNLDYFQHHHPESDTSLPPGLMDELVEFSRTNANILKIAHRLTFNHVFEPSASWERIKNSITPVDGSDMKFDHLGVDPHVTADTIITQGMYQIQLYQAIREYAQDSAAINKTYVTATSTYILPCLYALLGAFLYTCRTQEHNDQPPVHGSRFAMAFILGATISVFGSLVPKDVLLSPAAIAFVAGYSIDAFTARLDALVDKLKHSRPTRRAAH
jgi:hypothetical protein